MSFIFGLSHISPMRYAHTPRIPTNSPRAHFSNGKANNFNPPKQREKNMATPPRNDSNITRTLPQGTTAGVAGIELPPGPAKTNAFATEAFTEVLPKNISPTSNSVTNKDLIFSIGVKDHTTALKIQTSRRGDKEQALLKNAFNCFKMAAEQGHAEAMFYLASCYHGELGTQRDIKLSYYWAQKAIQSGYKDPKRPKRVEDFITFLCETFPEVLDQGTRILLDQRSKSPKL